MKAMVRDRYGPPEILQLRDVERPVPEDDMVLLEVHATSLNKSDWYALNPPRRLRLLMGRSALKPERDIIGSDVAGRVVAVGKDVARFKVGDEVFGSGRRVLAEYAVAREKYLVRKPDNVTFAQAATIPLAGTTALQGLRKGKIQSRRKVLIDGSSGSVGVFTLQLAKYYGVSVTAVCSTSNVANSRSMGADDVVDYTQEDFAKRGQKYDLVLGVNGNHSVLSYRRILNPEGAYVMVGSSRIISSLVQTVLLGPLLSRTGDKKVGFMGIAKLNLEDLNTLKDLLEAGKLRPIIDRTYPLSETAQAFDYFGEGHVQGKVVITVDHEAS
jgi:NADPH:quinone reductase-like Zn-dependent oxidoreductase